MTARVALCAAATVAAVFTAAPAVATEATSSEVRSLAEDAAFDDDALERLRQIDEIDGRPVDLERLLAGAKDDEVRQRVEALLPEDVTDGGRERDPDAERTRARAILQHERYRPDEIPRPFRGPLEWIADRIEPIGDAIDSFFEAIGEMFGALAAGTPGGAATLLLLFGAAVIALVVWQTRRVIERKNASRATELDAPGHLRSDHPRDLERRALAARDRGEHELAVRLLFRAGLIRLARARIIPARQSLTTGQVRNIVSLPEFDRLGLTFDEIAYGRRGATEADTSAARAGWQQVLHKVAQ